MAALTSGNLIRNMRFLSTNFLGTSAVLCQCVTLDLVLIEFYQPEKHMLVKKIPPPLSSFTEKWFLAGSAKIVVMMYARMLQPCSICSLVVGATLFSTVVFLGLMVYPVAVIIDSRYNPPFDASESANRSITFGRL